MATLPSGIQRWLGISIGYQRLLPSPTWSSRANLTVVVRYKRHVGEVLTAYVPIALTGGIGRLIYADR